MNSEKYFGLSPRIARWKLDTPVENRLSYKADYSEFWKKIYVLYYKIFDYKYFKKGYEMAKTAIINHKSGEDLTDINSVVRDMIYCLHRYGFSFQDYCIYDFAHNQDITYRQSFVSDKLRYHYCDLLNTKEIYQIMTDKYSCYKNYAQFFKRDVVGCLSQNDETAYKEFLSLHTKFIYKPLEEHSGHGVEIFNTSDIEADDFFRTRLSKGSFVLEELIEQGDEIARMHPRSVNTCRVVTFTKGSNVNIIGVTWRVGSGDAIKDNAGSGGMYAFVNSQTGVVETDAINYKGEHYMKHPNTGIQFEGFQMPSWNDAVSLIQQLATLINGSTLIAWDIAFSDKGWVMVEANENGDWGIIQSNKKQGLKNQLQRYMDEYLIQ